VAHLIKPHSTAVSHFLQFCNVSNAEWKQRLLGTCLGQRQQTVKFLPYCERRLETNNTKHTQNSR